MEKSRERTGGAIQPRTIINPKEMRRKGERSGEDRESVTKPREQSGTGKKRLLRRIKKCAPKQDKAGRTGTEIIRSHLFYPLRPSFRASHFILTKAERSQKKTTESRKTMALCQKQSAAGVRPFCSLKGLSAATNRDAARTLSASVPTLIPFPSCVSDDPRKPLIFLAFSVCQGIMKSHGSWRKAEKE